MNFNFYTNTINRASRSLAAGIFIAGLLLIGFGVIIIALPALFAALAAMVFAVAGVGCIVTAVKIFIFQRTLDKDKSQDAFRENVHVRTEEEEL